MPNLATLLKNEISRVARKEQRGESLALKKSVSAHRTEIAALKRRILALEQQLRRLSKASARAAPQADDDDAPGRAFRFSAKGLAAQRRRLGLSAAECGLLLGTSAQSVYNWEAGEIRPRVRHLAAIAALRGLGKREAAARLAELSA